ncbi:MAG: hypothetical protein IH611_09490 [Deltaproteobacteria bacterium]|nr:hypothetical protein [Deltaproteobacteria bacterium]
MKPVKCMKLSVVALALVVGTAGLASAALVEYQGTTYGTVTGANQYLATAIVGGADVTIGSFGVYGQAQVAGNIKWLIFDTTQLSSPVYLSASQAVSADPGEFASNAQWYDSPETNFTLLAGHTYAMGLIADQVGASSFRWGRSAYSPFGPGPDITGGGLTLKFLEKLDNSGLVNGVFTNTPTLYNLADNRFETSLRINAPAPVVPIPSTMLLLGSGLAGLVGIGRRRMKK